MSANNSALILALGLLAIRGGVCEAEPLPAFATSLHLPGLTNEVVRFRVGKIEQGFAKRGFFHLGLFPSVRLHEVEMAFETGRGLAHLEEAFTHAKGLGLGNQVEVAQTSIKCTETPFFQVSADSVEKLSAGRITFGGTATVVTTGKTNRLVHAVLRYSEGTWLVIGRPLSGESQSTKTILLK